MEFPFIPNIKPNELNDLILKNSNPSVFTYISIKSGYPITIPVWTYHFDNKFYIFTGENSQKAKTIRKGNTQVNLTVINNNSFPAVYGLKVPYISISGDASIVSWNENNRIAGIYISLLEKYNVPNQGSWIHELIQYWKDHPDEAWLIEIRPQKIFYFRE